jgi:hypothetical protein
VRVRDSRRSRWQRTLFRCVTLCSSATFGWCLAAPAVGHERRLNSSVSPQLVSRVTGSRLAVLRLPGQDGAQTGNLLNDGVPYAIVEQHAWRCNLRHRSLEQLLSGACLHGPTCLVFEGFQAADGCGSDRIEVKLSNSERPSALRLGETVYLRFDLNVDHSVDGLRRAALISQVWQASSVAVGGRPALGPVFAISIGSSRTDPSIIDVDFRYRNEVSSSNPPHPFFSQAIRKGEWHTFHVEMTPRQVGHQEGRGQILVWVDHGQHETLEPSAALNFRAGDDSGHRFHWGYPPDPTTSLGNSFDVRVGIYRPEPLTQIKFWMDRVLLTRDKSLVTDP